MKSFEHLVALAIIVLLTTACGSRTNKNNVQGENTDSVTIDTFTSPDLTLNELKGHVHTCKTFNYDASLKDNEYVIKDTKVTPSLLTFTEKGYLNQNGIYDLTYDEQGKLIKGVNTTDKNMKISVERNKNKYLTALICEDKQMGMESDQAYRINYKWNDKNEMIEEQYQGWEWSTANQYKYNDKGLREELTNTENPDYEEQIDNTYTYLYTKFDDRGNWTERNIQAVSVTSTLDMEGNMAKENAPVKSYHVEKREIVYY